MDKFKANLEELDGYRKLCRVMAAIYDNELGKWGEKCGDYMALHTGFSIGQAMKEFREASK